MNAVTSKSAEVIACYHHEWDHRGLNIQFIDPGGGEAGKVDEGSRRDAEIVGKENSGARWGMWIAEFRLMIVEVGPEEGREDFGGRNVAAPVGALWFHVHMARSRERY